MVIRILKNFHVPQWQNQRTDGRKTAWWFGCHFWHFPINIGNVIIPIDFHIFQRGGPGPPTSSVFFCWFWAVVLWFSSIHIWATQTEQTGWVDWLAVGAVNELAGVNWGLRPKSLYWLSIVLFFSIVQTHSSWPTTKNARVRFLRKRPRLRQRHHEFIKRFNIELSQQQWGWQMIAGCLFIKYIYICIYILPFFTA